MTVLVFITLIFLSGFFSAAEIAFFSLSPGQLRSMIEKRENNSRLIWKLRRRPQKLLISILIGNNIVNVFTAALATSIATDYFGSLGIGIATGVVTVLILVFGEITPKSFAQKNNKLIAKIFSPVLVGLMYFLFPFIWVLEKFNNIILVKLLKLSRPYLVTEEEIRSLTRLGVETGVIDYRERELIENVFKFDDVKAGEIMTMKYRMVSLNGDVSVEQIAHFVGQSGFSRYPVYEGGNDDRIVGYVHVNDIMRTLNSDKREKLVKEISRSVKRIKETMKVERVFRMMIREHEHLVLVKRSEGEDIIGVITLEDILEQLVGDITDETDNNNGG